MSRATEKDQEGKGKKIEAMVATWSDEDLDASTDSQEKDNLCLMAHGKEAKEVIVEEENSFSIDELELAYSHFLEKYRKLRHDNKDLKKKIEQYAHDSSSCFECVFLKEEIDRLNDLIIERENHE